MTVNAATVTDTSASVTVTPPAGTSATDFDRFVVEVCPAGTTSDCPTTNCTPSAATACTVKVDGLTGGTSYSVRAAAVKGSATGLQSEAVQFTTRYP